MSDDVDFANDAYAEWLSDKIAEQRRAVVSATRLPVNTCYYCGEPVGPGVLFCDDDCFDDLRKVERHAQINGSEA